MITVSGWEMNCAQRHRRTECLKRRSPSLQRLHGRSFGVEKYTQLSGSKTLPSYIAPKLTVCG
jgi:hypothetical protein